MCGIAGYLDFSNSTSSHVLQDMVNTLNHRGPDRNGCETIPFADCTVGLGQSRLAIIDLTDTGNQPMHYEGLSIVFNGEIYNFKEIRKELERLGHSFASNSDTEVILHAYDQWGMKAVKKFVGMFAFALLDRRTEKLIICRDHAGVKPLYYFYRKGLLLFASELKALHRHPAFVNEIDDGAVALYFDLGYIPSPYTIYRSCNKLEPGHFLVYNLKTGKHKKEKFWDINEFYTEEKLEIGYTEARSEVHSLLKKACNYRMIADVPVGVFLSGGYDSSAVTAIVQSTSAEKLKTFTIGFEDGVNEAPFARETARFLGTDHTEMICTTREAQAIIPELSYIYDEPFADSSAIPTILVSRLARRSVKVALSADAGDEVFAGYQRYSFLKQSLSNFDRIPARMKRSIGRLIRLSGNMLPDSRLAFKHKMATVAESLDANRMKQAVNLFRMMNSLPENYRRRIFSRPLPQYTHSYYQSGEDFKHEMEIAMAIDYRMYLQDDILTKVDRASMSVSLEGREPLLDHKLIEFVARLPLQFKHNGNSGKRILKDIVHEYIPRPMMSRPKTGFSLPINSWLRGDLSFLLDEYLNEQALGLSGLFNVKFVSGQVDLFRRDQLYYKPVIWMLLMFQMWYMQWQIKQKG